MKVFYVSVNFVGHNCVTSLRPSNEETTYASCVMLGGFPRKTFQQHLGILFPSHVVGLCYLAFSVNVTAFLRIHSIGISSYNSVNETAPCICFQYAVKP